MKLLSLVVAACLVVISWSAAGAEGTPKFAFFAMSNFMQHSAKAKEQQKKVVNLMEQKRTALENKKKELITKGEELQKQGAMLKEEKRNEMIIDIKKKEIEYQMAEQEAKQALQNEEREFMEMMQRDITRVIKKIREQKNIDFVFTSEALISANDAMDISDEVVKLYDADGEVGKPVARPRPAAAPRPKAPAPK